MKFSILIPAYKNNFLEECIESILSQTYTDFELIIVDDASPYDIVSVVSKFNDSRIRYYRNETNCGAINVVDNWNICLKYAVGEYVICMGDDDKLLPNCLEEYEKLIFSYPKLNIYHAWTDIIDENSNIMYSTPSRGSIESVYFLIWHRWFYRKEQFIGDFLFKTSFLKQIGGFYKLPLAWFSDDITAAMAAEKGGIANTQIVTFQYRMNSCTISSTGNSTQKMNATILSKKWYKNFLQKETNDPSDEKIRKQLLNSIDNFFNQKYKENILFDLKSNGIFRIFYWIIFSIKNDIPSVCIIQALLKYLKL